MILCVDDKDNTVVGRGSQDPYHTMDYVFALLDPDTSSARPNSRIRPQKTNGDRKEAA